MSFASVPDQDPRDDLAFLRLHIEACWGPHPPALVPGEQTLLPGGTEPPWKVYLADTAPGRVVLWRPDVAVERRETLLARATASLACPPDSALDPDVRREVVLRLAASPPDNIVPRDATIRRLTAADAPLFAAFDPDDPPYYVRAENRPCARRDGGWTAGERGPQLPPDRPRVRTWPGDATRGAPPRLWPRGDGALVDGGPGGGSRADLQRPGGEHSLAGAGARCWLSPRRPRGIHHRIIPFPSRSCG